MVDIYDDNCRIGGVGEVNVLGQVHPFPRPDQRLTVTMGVPGLRPRFGDPRSVFRTMQTLTAEMVEQDLSIMLTPPDIGEFAALMSGDMGIKPTIPGLLVGVLVGVALGV